MTSKHAHPYFPLDLELPGYQPLVIPFERILAIFFGCSALVILGMWFYSGEPAQDRVFEAGHRGIELTWKLRVN